MVERRNISRNGFDAISRIFDVDGFNVRGADLQDSLHHTYEKTRKHFVAKLACSMRT